MKDQLRKTILENDGDRDDIYSDVLLLLESQWVSVNDRFPDYGVPVIVCEVDNKDSVEICRLESKTERKEGVSHDWLQGKTSHNDWYYNVTHWQPLPALPTE